MVLVLYIDESQLLSFILADELRQLLTLLNLVKALDKLVCECFYPLDVLVLDFDKGLAYRALPLVDDVDVWRVFVDDPGDHVLDPLEILQVRLVAFINILQVFLLDQAFEALVFAFLARPESSRGVVLRAVDPQRALREPLLRVEQESVVDDVLLNVAFEVDRCSLLLVFVDQSGDDVKGRWILESTQLLALDPLLRSQVVQIGFRHLWHWLGYVGHLVSLRD